MFWAKPQTELLRMTVCPNKRIERLSGALLQQPDRLGPPSRAMAQVLLLPLVGFY